MIKAFLPLMMLFLSSAYADTNRHEILELIRSRDLRSLEEVLPLLPSAQRDHFALAHAGKGAQETSAMQPRVLLFGSTAKMILAFNGEASQAGYWDLEMREFNESSAQFEYSFVRFKQDKSRPEFSSVNPTQCTRCHGDNPVPIYEDYDSGWPGFYPDLASARDQNPEKGRYERFIGSMAEHPRFRHLNQAFMAPPEFTRDHASIQPLNMLGKLEARLLGIHIAKEFTKSPDFAGLKYSAIYLGMVRSSSICPYSTDLYDKVMARFRQVIARKYGRTEWFPRIDVEDRIAVAFDYHQVIDKYAFPGPQHPMDYAFWSDGLDRPRSHALSALLQQERELGTELGKMVQPRPGRMERYYQGRYIGTPSAYLDQALTYADFGGDQVAACALLAQKVAGELAR